MHMKLAPLLSLSLLPLLADCGYPQKSELNWDTLNYAQACGSNCHASLKEEDHINSIGKGKK